MVSDDIRRIRNLVDELRTVETHRAEVFERLTNASPTVALENFISTMTLMSMLDARLLSEVGSALETIVERLAPADD